jgi:hypothetical protein
MSLKKIETFVRTCDRTCYDVVAQQGSEPSLKDVAAFEKKIGFAFPAEYRRYLCHPLGGLIVEVHEELWPRPKAWDVGPAWSFAFGVYAYTLCSAAPDWLSMQTAWAEMCEQGHPELVPVLRVACDADPYCYTKKGKLVIWRHETPDEPDAFDGDFFDALAYELGELEQRKDRKLAERQQEKQKPPVRKQAKKAKPKQPARAKTKAKQKQAKRPPAKRKK